MQLWHYVAIVLAVSVQSPPAQAAAKKVSKSDSLTLVPSCLQVLGALGAEPDPAIRVVDGTTLNSVSDLRSLRSKAKDGLPIIIKGGDFSGKKFGGDNYSNLCFDGTNLSNTRWSKSRADGAAFINANLSGAIFDRVTMRKALFRNSVLARMNAGGANLADGQFDGGWDPSIAGLRLDNAQMAGFRFRCGTTSIDGCSFDRKQISLSGANLTNASLAEFALWDANLSDVILNKTEIALDQIPQYANANIQGPLLILAGGKRTEMVPAAFRLAVAELGAPARPDTECSNPATPLSQIFCQTGQASLRAYRDDVDRLYQATITNARADTSAITVVGPGKEQDRYLSSLRKCALKDEAKAIPCVTDKMTKRRGVLTAVLTKSSPLEPDARALFVSPETPLLQSLARDARLSSLTPLLIGSASTFLLAYRDDDNLLNARGISQSQDGARCVYGFAPFATSKSRKKKSATPAFLAWSSGAEFAVKPLAKAKAKKAKKPKKGKRGAQQVATVAADPSPSATATPGCATTVQSGPLVRVPVSEQDFDLLWAEYRSAG